MCTGGSLPNIFPIRCLYSVHLDINRLVLALWKPSYAEIENRNKICINLKKTKKWGFCIKWFSKINYWIRLMKSRRFQKCVVCNCSYTNLLGYEQSKLVNLHWKNSFLNQANRCVPEVLNVVPDPGESWNRMRKNMHHWIERPKKPCA